jgi:hypothetical protein
MFFVERDDKMFGHLRNVVAQHAHMDGPDSLGLG